MAGDPLARPVLAVDFDWVLHAGSGVVPEGGSISGDPAVPGALDWLHQVAQVFHVVVFSTSADNDASRTAIVNWLTDQGFVGQEYTVTNEKPDAVAYVDDRGWRVDGPGTYPSVDELLAFKPWWKLDPEAAAVSAAEAAQHLAAEAKKAEPGVTPVVEAVAAETGGTVVGAENRLKSVDALRAKVDLLADDMNQRPGHVAANVKDALRYAVTYPPVGYTNDVHVALAALAADGHDVQRVRNYWAPTPPPGTRQPVGTYYGINANVTDPGGYRYEVQFHTPDSYRVNDELNWPLYDRVRQGDLTDAELADTLAEMRSNLQDVEIPVGASSFQPIRPVPHPQPLVAAADERPTVDIAEHNAITAKAAARAWEELEPRLARLIEPVLARAGRQAAAKFKSLTSRSLTADAYRTADRRRLAAMPPDAARALIRSLALTAAGVPGLSPNSTMVAVMPTAEQANALAIGDQDADVLHVTLAYLGEVTGDLHRVAEALGPVAASFAPLQGKVAGGGQFGDSVQLLLPDVPGLVELRVAVTDALVDADIDYGREHGYQPHITVGYLPGVIPPDEHYRLSTLGGPEACSTCSYFEARGWCQMFGAKAMGDMVCDDWTDVPPPPVPTGAPLDFVELLIVRGNDEYVRLPLVGVPALTAAATGSRGLQSAETQASVAALLADETILESQVERAIRAAKTATEAASLTSARDEMERAKEHVIEAQHLGDPERVFAAQLALRHAQDKVRALMAAESPVGPQLPPGTTPPGQQQPTVGPPGHPQPAGPPQKLPEAKLPQAPEIGKEIQKDSAQDIFAPSENSATAADSVKLAGENLTQLLEQEAFLAQPAEGAIERVEATPPDWTRPARSEIVNTDELMQQVRGVTDPVRQAVIQSVATPVLDNIGIGWDESNPFAARVLAQSASQITAITETTQADVMDVINLAYQQGLTIDDTAKLIQLKMKEASPARARLIARTELAGAVNGGSLAATQIVSSATGTPYVKTWRTAPGAPHPRHENYADLDGQHADLDGLFTVGDAQLHFPGDPDGPPGESCNCRCALTYEEASNSDATAPTVSTADVPSGVAAPSADAHVVPAGTLQTSDPAEAAKALAAGQDVVLNQPDEISTFLEDLGKQAADAQAAGVAAPNLDLGKVSVKGTNLFTQDSLGIPRIDMPQLSGTPLPGSLASKLPGGYEGQADQVDIGPLFYQHLRDQGVSITSEDVLASHLRSTQKDINGAKVAKLMDRLESGQAQERVIPISADNYILDGHHEWAATIGWDYKTGTDAGLTLPVMRINQPITKILSEANAFDEHYGIPHVSAFVPPVKDAGTVRVLDRAAAKPKDPILGITPFRAGEDNALGFYDSAKAQQFEADLKQTAAKDGLTITSSQHVTGVWEGETEPSYSVHMLGDPAKVNLFAEEMRARYNQDGVMVFVPQKDMPKGMTQNASEFRIGPVNPDTAISRMQQYGLSGGTIRGHTLSIVSTEPSDAVSVASLADNLGVDPANVKIRYGHVDFVNRPEDVAAPPEPGKPAVAPSGSLKAPDPVTEMSAAPGGKHVYDQQFTQATGFLAKDLPTQFHESPLDTLQSGSNRAYAKQQIADDIAARLKDNADWNAAIDVATPHRIAVEEMNVGDVVRLAPDAPTFKVESLSGVTPAASPKVSDLGVGDEVMLEKPVTVEMGAHKGLELKALDNAPSALKVKLRVTTDPGKNGVEGVVLNFDPIENPKLKIGMKVMIPNEANVSYVRGLNTVKIEGTITNPTYGYRVGDHYKVDLLPRELTEIDRFNPNNQHPFPYGWGGFENKTDSALAVSGLVDTWAATAADENPWALALQKAINDQFKLEPNAASVLSKRDTGAWHDANDIYKEKGAALRAFVQAEYDNTQKMLADSGVKDVLLYRGYTLNELSAEAKAKIPLGGHVQEVELQPGSSFTSTFGTSKDFTGGDSVIVAAHVPADRIIGTARSGVGCLNEAEFVVMGRPAGFPADQAWAYRFRGYNDRPTSMAAFWTAPEPVPTSWTAVRSGTTAELKAGDVFKLTDDGSVFKVVEAAPSGAGTVKVEVVTPSATSEFQSGDTNYIGANEKVAAVAKMGATPSSVDPTTLKVGDKVKVDLNKSGYLAGPTVAADTVLEITSVGHGVVQTKVVDKGSAKNTGSTLLYKDEYVFPISAAPAAPAEMKSVTDMKAGEQFSVPTAAGHEVVYEVTTPAKDGIATVKVIDPAGEPGLSVGDPLPMSKLVDGKVVVPPPPVPTASTKWSFGEPVVTGMTKQGDLFKFGGGIYKNVGKNDNGDTLGEIVDQGTGAMEVGTVIPFGTSTLVQPAAPHASAEKPPKPGKWEIGNDVINPKDGDFVKVIGDGKNTYETQGAIFHVLPVNKLNPDLIHGTVVDPGKSKLNVGETYLLPGAGLAVAKPLNQPVKT